MDELNELLKKQAQELVLPPSPSVWMNVEADIARRERRRRWFFWLFLLVFFLSGVILYTVFAEKNTSHLNALQSSSPKATNVSGHKTAIATETIKTTDNNTKAAPRSIQPQHAVDADYQADVPPVDEVMAPVSRAAVAPVTRIEKVQPRAFAARHTTQSVNQPFLEPVAMKMPEKDEMSALQPATPSDIRPVNTAPGNRQVAATGAHHVPKEMRPLQKEAVTPLRSTPSFAKITVAQPGRTIQQPAVKEPVPQSRITSPAAHVPGIKTADTVIQEEIVQKQNLPPMIAPADTVPVTLPLKIKESRWSFTASIAPSLNFSRVEEHNNDSTFIAQTRSSSKKLVSTNVSIAAWYKVSPRLEVYSGLGIRNLGERMKSVQNIYALDSGFLANANKHVVVRKKLIKGDSSDLITNRFSYLEIPLGLRFGLITRKQWGIYLHADISASYLLSAKGYYYNYTARSYLAMNNDRLQNWLLAYGAGISLQYNLRKHIGIECMPYFRNYPSSVYKADEQNKVSQYFQQSGLQFSVRYYPGRLRRK